MCNRKTCCCFFFPLVLLAGGVIIFMIILAINHIYAFLIVVCQMSNPMPLETDRKALTNFTEH